MGLAGFVQQEAKGNVTDRGWHPLHCSMLLCPLWCCQAMGTASIANIYSRHGSGQTIICRTH